MTFPIAPHLPALLFSLPVPLSPTHLPIVCLLPSESLGPCHSVCPSLSLALCPSLRVSLHHPHLGSLSQAPSLPAHLRSCTLVFARALPPTACSPDPTGSEGGGDTRAPGEECARVSLGRKGGRLGLGGASWPQIRQ